MLAKMIAAGMAFVVLPLAPSVCGAQAADTLTMGRIVAAWKSREHKAMCARFELTTEETFHKGSTSILENPRRQGSGLPAEPLPNPPRDYIVKGTTIVTLGKDQMRYSYDQPQWDPVGKQLYREQYVDTFDGRVFKFLQTPATAGEDHAFGSVKRAETPPSATKFPLLPLVVAFRGSDPKFFRDLDKFAVRPKSVTVAGRPCREMERGPTALGGREVLFLDGERDYVVIKHIVFAADQPNWQMDITYSRDPEAGWVPQSWEYLIRVGKDRQVVNSGRTTVSRYELNRTLDTGEFDIVFPPKAMVLDQDNGTQYVVRENGSKGRQIPAATSPSYQELAAGGSSWTSAAIWGGVFLVALAGWIVIRKRRLKGNQPVA